MNTLSISRDGLPYNTKMEMTMIQMKETLSHYSNALESANSKQAQAEIYMKRAYLYFQYGLHNEALRDCNSSYYCCPSSNVVQLRNSITKKIQATQYEFNQTGINILKEKLQHAMQERNSFITRQI